MFWLFLLLPLWVCAQSNTNLSSDLPMEFDGIHNSVTARQNAVFVHNDLTVIADEIKYNKNDDEAIATGNVRLNFKGTRLVAKIATYKVKEGSFTAEDFRLGYFPYMIKGKKISGTRERLVLEHSTLYTSQTGTLAPNLYMTRLTLYPQEQSAKMKVQSAVAKLGPVALLPIPFASANVPYNYPMSLNVIAGNSKFYGTYLRTEVLYPINPNLKAGTNLDYYSHRGWLYGPRLEWTQGSISSHLSSGYISDRGDKGVDVRGLPISKERGFVDFNYKQTAGPLQITSQTQYWSDSEVLRVYRPRVYRDSQAPESFAEAVLPLKDTYVSLFTRYDPNNFETFPSKIPELRIDRLNTPLGGTGAYYSFYNSFAHLEENSLSYNRYDGILSVNRPTPINNWWQFNPVVATRYTYYDTTTSGSGTVGRLLGQFGFDNQWSFYNTNEVKSSLWNVDGLKHTVQPVLQYRYLPGASTGQGKIPPIETRVFDTNLKPLDFFYRTDIDQPQSQNIVRFGLKQSLQTRNSNSSQFPTRDLLTFDLYQDYNFNTSADQRHLDNFYILSEATPNEWITFGAFVRLNSSPATLQEHRLYLSLKDADYRTLTFSTRYLRNNVDQYGVTFTQRLTDRLTLFADTVYDVQTSSFVDLFYGLQQRLRSGWEVVYGVEKHTGDLQDNSTQLTVRMRWLNF